MSAHAADFGIEASKPSVNFAVTQQRKNKIVAGLVGGIAAMCKGRNVEVFNGVGSLGPDHTVTVEAPDGTKTTITGRNVILAAGSVPRMIPNFERGGPIMSSDEVLDLDHVPDRMVVIGGGAIGCEFASTFADLGSKVTILEALPKLLPGLDNDVTNVVVRSFKKKKIDIRTNVMVTGHTPNDSGGTTVHFGEDEHVEVDAVVVSVGRRPFADRLGLDGTGVKVDSRGFVVVDEFCRTGEDGVYRHRRPDRHAPARPRRLRRGDPRRQADARRIRLAGDVRPGAVGHLLPPGGGLGWAGRRAGQGCRV